MKGTEGYLTTAESQPFCTCTAAASCMSTALPATQHPIFLTCPHCCVALTTQRTISFSQLTKYCDIFSKYACYINSSQISFASDAAAQGFIVHTLTMLFTTQVFPE